ncbi:hypothetical protein J3E69DRAFT_66801 [Trichoderma sp. SZMC 28015]
MGNSLRRGRRWGCWPCIAEVPLEGRLGKGRTGGIRLIRMIDFLFVCSDVGIKMLLAPERFVLVQMSNIKPSTVSLSLVYTEGINSIRSVCLTACMTTQIPPQLGTCSPYTLPLTKSSLVKKTVALGDPAWRSMLMLIRYRVWYMCSSISFVSLVRYIRNSGGDIDPIQDFQRFRHRHIPYPSRHVSVHLFDPQDPPKEAERRWFPLSKSGRHSP